LLDALARQVFFLLLIVIGILKLLSVLYDHNFPCAELTFFLYTRIGLLLRLR
jgi:hypothetical protein